MNLSTLLFLLVFTTTTTARIRPYFISFTHGRRRRRGLDFAKGTRNNGVGGIAIQLPPSSSSVLLSQRQEPPQWWESPQPPPPPPPQQPITPPGRPPQQQPNDGRNSVLAKADEMEREMRSSLQSKIDERAVDRAVQRMLDADAEPLAESPTELNVAVASGVATFAFVYLGPFHWSWFPSTIAALGAFYLAVGDPHEEEGVGGAFSRLWGRQALRTADSAAPRLRAAARAAVIDANEIQSLGKKVSSLTKENEMLRYELALRRAAEESPVAARYDLGTLRYMAQTAGLPGLGGEDKAALLRKLWREGVLEIDLSPYYIKNEGDDN